VETGRGDACRGGAAVTEYTRLLDEWMLCKRVCRVRDCEKCREIERRLDELWKRR
jgi:hypothetical protein